MVHDEFDAIREFSTTEGAYRYFSLARLEELGLTSLANLPYSIRLLLENVLRNCNMENIGIDDVKAVASWKPKDEKRPSIPFLPTRVVMQDFTGVPAIVDLAAMRSAMQRLGGDPRKINPVVRVDLVIDHSVQVDFFASPDALKRNMDLEFQRNRERYTFLRWGQKSFDNLRVVPPATGIIHQVNLEYLAEVVLKKTMGDGIFAIPDTLVGTDSHTTMINGLGVLGWGVGGIEAEAAMLGQPIDMLLPDVIGFKLSGELREGVTATDLVLTIVQKLRQRGVVGKFVEFFGPGLASLSLPDRATIANMAPEYGATMGFFPVDEETIRYLRLTGRSEEIISRVEKYTKLQGLFREYSSPEPMYTDVLELDLSDVEASIAGPKRPQDRIALKDVKKAFKDSLVAPVIERGFQLSEDKLNVAVTVGTNGTKDIMHHGSVVIAAITSCTNTSNPSVMVGAGLLAKKAVERGLKVKPFVKTSLAPGSKVVTKYLEASGLIEPLSKLGFNVVGYGCTTCIGNSGPLPSEVVRAISEGDLVAAAVLSGNRNFEGRVHSNVKANYLASPPLVVAYALAGRVDIDLLNEPLGEDSQGKPVYLHEIWPSAAEITQVIEETIKSDIFREEYSNVFDGNEIWNQIEVSGGDIYEWDIDSTYIQEPPFFLGITPDVPSIEPIRGARVLALLGDSITTDHISPAGTIPAESPAGKYLIEKGVKVRDFNSYGSRRGNDRVMTRGTFANIRLKNRLVPGKEGGYTIHLPDGEELPIFDAAMRYKQEGIPLIVIAGKEYGTGSSRDWAAKGTLLLGVKAVLAESFERIHRSNLVGMGVLPLQFMPGENADALGLTGRETFTINGLSDELKAGQLVEVTASSADGESITFHAKVRLDTVQEVAYYRNGGILHYALRRLLK